jgi:putative flavoprotein involved in K+ transport
VPRTTAIIIGAGQAGLAMSHCLSKLGIDHVVLERGQVAQRWRSSSWNSLRLLTPNWMTRLPGFGYAGDDPDGFMAVPELIGMLEQYAQSSQAPVLPHTTVHTVDAWGNGFRVGTNRGQWCASAVVIATGYCDLPAVPSMSKRLTRWIHQLLPSEYRHAEQLPPGGVLIVGASSTGVQLADEIRTSGRRVTLAVGRHTRLPRHYRGRDILWWLDRLGILSQSLDSVHSIDISRNQPSLQLVGRADHASLDIGVLRAQGVRLVGRLRGIDGRRVAFDTDLAATTAAADVKLAEIRARIDEFIARTGTPATDPEPFEPAWSLAPGLAELDLRAHRIETVIWATGYRRAYPWLRIPVLDARGEIRHRGGITPRRGLYVLGLHFQRRRNSSFIDGVGSDAAFLAEHLAESLVQTRIA